MTMFSESVTSEPASRPPSSKLRWVFLTICGALLAILSVSGLLAFHYLRQMYARELAITQALEERAQMLSGLSLSIQRYNQDVQKFVTAAQAEGERPSHQQLDQLTLEIESDLKSYPAERDSAESSLLDGFAKCFRSSEPFTSPFSEASQTSAGVRRRA